MRLRERPSAIVRLTLDRGAVRGERAKKASSAGGIPAGAIVERERELRLTAHCYTRGKYEIIRALSRSRATREDEGVVGKD